MLPTQLTCSLALLSLLLSSATVALAQPQPGDVYRDYAWRDGGAWQRVTGPDATASGAQEFLPNSVNHLRIDDFDHAIRAEISIEMLQSHAGTAGKRVRLNGGSWLTIPAAPLIPGTSGKGGSELAYQAMRYPVVPLSLNTLTSGNNTLEFTAQGTPFSPYIGGSWPQWLVYGATVRVYYDSDKKAHPTGQITSPLPNAKIGQDAVFQATTSSARPIEQVNFVGKYTDFNWEGDGEFRQWQDQTFFSKLRNHIGTDTQAPYNVAWDNEWIPDQEEPMEVTARILDDTGLTYVTPAVSGLELERPYSVSMHTPFSVPRPWNSRNNITRLARIDVPEDLSDATAAQITISTWSGQHADELGLNGEVILNRLGKLHDLSYDTFGVPLELIQQGTNTFHTFSETIHHGIDVNWPGPVLMIRHDPIPEPSTSGLFSIVLAGLSGCRCNRRPPPGF